MIVIPIIALRAPLLFGEPRPKKWAYRIIIISRCSHTAFSLPNAIRVSQRMNDRDFGCAASWKAMAWFWHGLREVQAGLMQELRGRRPNACAPTCRGWHHHHGEAQTSGDYDSRRSRTVHDAPRGKMQRCLAPEQEKARLRAHPDKETPLWMCIPKSSTTGWPILRPPMIAVPTSSSTMAACTEKENRGTELPQLSGGEGS